MTESKLPRPERPGPPSEGGLPRPERPGSPSGDFPRPVRTDREGNPIEQYRQVAEGGMSREGTTTVVKIRQSLAPEDHLTLCTVICQCKDTPGVGKNGQSLKQVCVSQRLTAYDRSKLWQSPYKAEVNYDMLANPPAPIMSPNNPLKPHGYLPEWIKSGRPAGYPPYTPGAGMVRRPDVVVVNDPTLPPRQDNIKKVVEIKFPPDADNEWQRSADVRIAGHESKREKMGPNDCNCDEIRRQQPVLETRRVDELGWAGKIAEKLVRVILSGPGGRNPPPQPAPAR